ncbi:MAG: hypothetical protein ACE14T_02365 [Syntrophales bacterium]
MGKMERFLIVLIAAVSMATSGTAAYAVDVGFSGDFRAEGWLDSNRTLRDEPGTKAPATGIFDQRLRVATVFKVSEGLSLVTRFTALDKIWGDKSGGADTKDRLNDSTRFARENIEFDRVYASFKALKGQLDIGYMRDNSSGTVFGDQDDSSPQIKYTYYTGPWTFTLAYVKLTEKEVTNPASLSYANQSDIDYDKWKYSIVYKWATGDAGLSGAFYNDKTARSTASSSYQVRYHRFNPYARAVIGPVYVEGEVSYMTGDLKDYDESTTSDTTKRGWSWYLNGRYNIGPAYVGAQYAYVGGDDPGTAGKNEQGYPSGREYKPCLILFNSDRDKYLGALGSGATAVLGNTYTTGGAVNFQLYQGYVGLKPMSRLELFASYSYVKLNEKPVVNGVQYVDDKIGTEADITATYKIYDNLSYMVGFGYLWAGDAWKGTSASAQVADDWLLMHRLTLNF